MFKKLTVLFLVLAVLLASACGKTLKTEGAKLNCFDGLNEDGSYDSSLFYRNDLTVFGGDSDVLWVPEERDAEYGGWFYQYTSGNGGVATIWNDGYETCFAVSCLRSRDLNDWELCGAVDNGFAIELQRDDWIKWYVWAPEAEYDEKSGLYFIYVSCRAWENPGFDPSLETTTSDGFGHSFYIAVCSSPTPVGPFTLVTSEEFYGTDVPDSQKDANGNILNLNGDMITRKNPAINFRKAYGLDYDYGVIAASPFYDENGDLYMYFSREYSSIQHDSAGNAIPDSLIEDMSIWGMKMKDAITPDYDTLRMIAYPNKKAVRYKGGDANDPAYPIYEASSYELIDYDTPFKEDGTLNEGAQMLVHTDANGVRKYYLTYSKYGYDARDYGIHQAVSDSPLGPFEKVDRTKSAFVVNLQNDFMTGVGHHCYVEADGELFAIYWVHADPEDTTTAGNNGRVYAFDRQTYVYDEELGFDILYGNGPTASIQYKPSVASGVKNIAPEATVSVTGAADKATARYLNDGMFVATEAYAGMEYRADGKTVITLTFDQPREISGIMVYNSFDYQYAFSAIDAIVFDLAEKPDWYTLDEYNGKVYIENLGFNSDYYDAEGKYMRPGGSSLASFSPMKVKEISLSVSKKLSGGDGEIRISDIVVLGK